MKKNEMPPAEVKNRSIVYFVNVSLINVSFALFFMIEQRTKIVRKRKKERERKREE